MITARFLAAILADDVTSRPGCFTPYRFLDFDGRQRKEQYCKMTSLKSLATPLLEIPKIRQ